MPGLVFFDESGPGNACPALGIDAATDVLDRVVERSGLCRSKSQNEQDEDARSPVRHEGVGKWQ